MKIVLFRHAHKGITPFEDPELSPKGFEQSLLLLELVKKNSIPAPQHILVSPKIRTTQTLIPIARQFSIEPEILGALDQQSSSESGLDFFKRVSGFLNSLSSKFNNNECVYICTHYDCIEIAMQTINSDKNLNTFEFSHWSPAQYIEFEIEKDNPTVWFFKTKGVV